MNTCEFNLNRLGKHFLANSHWHLVCWYFFLKEKTYGLKPNIRSEIDIWPTKLNETYHQHTCFQILIAMFFFAKELCTWSAKTISIWHGVGWNIRPWGPIIWIGSRYDVGPPGYKLVEITPVTIYRYLRIKYTIVKLEICSPTSDICPFMPWNRSWPRMAASCLLLLIGRNVRCHRHAFEASDRAQHHQRSLGTCWRRCADSLGLRDFACPGEPALCLGYCRGRRNPWGRFACPSSNVSATVVQSSYNSMIQFHTGWWYGWWLMVI